MGTNKAFIPYYVLYDKKLTPMAKILYGELTTLCDKDGVCKASYQELAVKFSKSVRTISYSFQLLREGRYLETDGRKKIRLNLSKEELNYITENRTERNVDYAKL